MALHARNTGLHVIDDDRVLAVFRDGLVLAGGVALDDDPGAKAVEIGFIAQTDDDIAAVAELFVDGGEELRQRETGAPLAGEALVEGEAGDGASVEVVEAAGGVVEPGLLELEKVRWDASGQFQDQFDGAGNDGGRPEEAVLVNDIDVVAWRAEGFEGSLPGSRCQDEQNKG